MHVQISTDSNIEGGEDLTRTVTATVEDTLGRFGDWLTRVEVHLSDENGKKSRGDYKRCLMEARPAGHQPIVVSHLAATVEQAIDGAADRLARLLDDTAGRLGTPKGRTSFGGDQTN